MRIFLSYASEQRPIAEQIAYTLRVRGHFAFFDKEQLPVADSFDEQISLAIDTSDVLIFLISPEAVTPGRYTLTELVFARKKWPSPKGRVFPVLVAPTPLQTIPNYIRSVQFLAIEGNIAAEVASVVDGLIPTAKPSRILPIATLLGAFSGAISAGLFEPINNDLWKYVSKPVVEAFGSWIEFPIMMLNTSAPYVFSIVVGSLIKVWDKTTLLRALLVLPIIFTAWTCAVWTAQTIVIRLEGMQKGEYSSPTAKQCLGDVGNGGAEREKEICKEIDRYRDQIEPLLKPLKILVELFGGLAGGFVGSSIMMIGLGRISSRLRQLEAITLVVLVGTAAGSLLVGSDKGSFLLFIVWQAGVAAAIAWQFTNPAPREFSR
jgi:hypothetical protein